MTAWIQVQQHVATITAHSVLQKCEVFLPSSADSVPSDVWMGLCWMWSRLLEPNISLLHTEHNLYSLLLAHTYTNSKHHD